MHALQAVTIRVGGQNDHKQAQVEKVFLSLQIKCPGSYVDAVSSG